jgi:glycosyltransferase involved in cell wall biosynthesis
MRLPVVATDIRGCRQVVDDGATGRLVPARDAVGLAGAIEALAGDVAQRRRMAAAAREKALKEFDHRRCIDLTLAVYEELLGRRALTGVAA